jgi:benzoate-CoA ligase family protein
MLTYDDIPREFNLTTHFVDRHVEEGRGDRTALVTDDGPVTYADLAALTNRVGNALIELGVRQEERVLIALNDSPEFVASWYASLKIGAVTAEVYTFLAAKDFAYYLDYTRAAVAIVDVATLERFREASVGSRYLRRLLVVGAAPGTLRSGEEHFEALVAATPDALAPAPTSRDDIAIWKFTTGSTGAPKACVHRMHVPLISAEAYARGVLDIQPDDIVLPVPKLFFGYARDMTALFPFLVGAAGVVFAQRTTADGIFERIERHQPTILVNVPTMMRTMVDHPSAAERDLSGLRLTTSAGEGLPGELLDRWLSTFGVEVLDGIGSSEAYHIYVSSRPGAVRPGSLGQAVPGYEGRIVDAAGVELPVGETGRLWVKAPTAAVMYFNDRAKSVETYAGELVMTGDLFSRDEDGYFWYRGRADELLKVGGIWVAPAEIETCLRAHPAVTDCAVVGYEDEGLVKPRAFIVASGDETPSPELATALQAHVKSTLSPHKYPRDVRFVDDLPKLGSGKVDRAQLRRTAPAAAA